MAEDDSCVVCAKTVRPRQEALQCDGCDRWQHRTCNTGLSRTFYWQLVRGEKDLPDWRCPDCGSSDSSRLDELNTGRLLDVDASDISDTNSSCGAGVANLSDSDIFSSSDSDISGYSGEYNLGLSDVVTNELSDPVTSDSSSDLAGAEPRLNLNDFSFNVDQTCFPPSTPKIINGQYCSSQ